MACIPVFTDQLSHGKQQLFQGIRRRFQRVFLHFWEGEFRKTSVFQRSSPGKRKENISYSEVFLAFSGLAISSEFKKTGAFFWVRGVLLVFAFSVVLNIKKKGVFLFFLHSLSHPRSRSFPKFHDSQLLSTFKVWETKSGEDDNTFKVDFKNIIYLECKRKILLQVSKDSPS